MLSSSWWTRYVQDICHMAHQKHTFCLYMPSPSPIQGLSGQSPMHHSSVISCTGFSFECKHRFLCLGVWLHGSKVQAAEALAQVLLNGQDWPCLYLSHSVNTYFHSTSVSINHYEASQADTHPANPCLNVWVLPKHVRHCRGSSSAGVPHPQRPPPGNALCRAHPASPSQQATQRVPPPHHPPLPPGDPHAEGPSAGGWRDRGYGQCASHNRGVGPGGGV